MCKFLKQIRSLLIVALLLLSTNKATAEWHYDQQPIMGTQVSVTLWHENDQLAEQAIHAVMAEMHRIDHALSPYKPESELSKVNATAATKTQWISKELATLIAKSLYYSEISQGAFDITYASVGWHYDYREKKKPSQNTIDALLPAINYRLLALDESAATLKFGHENIRIDLGGLAKGYAVDKAVQILNDHGIHHASVSAGGDSRIIGDRRGRPWVVGIKNPRYQEGEPKSVIRLPLDNVAVSTSGDYERFFVDEKTGEWVHHIINPSTGKSTKSLMSVTIIGPQGIDTDPLSTTVFVLGVDKGLALINSIANFDAVIIERSGKVHYSNGLVAGD